MVTAISYFSRPIITYLFCDQHAALLQRYILQKDHNLYYITKVIYLINMFTSRVYCSRSYNLQKAQTLRNIRTLPV